MNGFEKAIAKYNGKGLYSLDVETIQVNIGLKCNLECVHCHVVSSPRRKEMMDWETMEHVIAAAGKDRCQASRYYRRCPSRNAPRVSSICKNVEGKRVPGSGENQPHDFASTGIRILPGFLYGTIGPTLCILCPATSKENVDAQRGTGVFEDSIAALRRLNSYGYGILPHLPLNLVYNPVGPYAAGRSI